MAFFIFLSLAFQGIKLLRGFSYTVVILAAASVAMYYPQYFLQVGNFRFSKLIVPLLQVIMFGMGTELSVQEFRNIIKMPKGILIGIFCHYTIMPMLGFAIATIFNFPNEIAAGIVLVGCCPSGLASNVMAYLARANLALSVSITIVSTLLAPLLTPVLLRLLGGQFVAVHFWDMVWDIVNIVIFPVGAGLIFHVVLRGRFRWLNRIMPFVSMAGIALIIVAITASGRESLMRVGLQLLFATFVQNTLGYSLGYAGARLFGLNEKDARTVSLEVGMQNAGLASGLALKMGKLATVGLAPAIFGPMMNTTGSALATWWHCKLPKKKIDV